jgi:hypothetical protein
MDVPVAFTAEASWQSNMVVEAGLVGR